MKRETIGVWAVQKTARTGGEGGSWVQVCPERFYSRSTAESFAQNCEIDDDEILMVIKVESILANEIDVPS